MFQGSILSPRLGSARESKHHVPLSQLCQRIRDVSP